MNNNSRHKETIEQNLYDNYRDPKSSTFLETDQHKLYSAAKTDASLFPVTYSEIDNFKQSVESISRSFERRLLRSRQRHLQYKKWLTYGPLNVICADLCFLPATGQKNSKKKIILVLLDCFSRLVNLQILKNSSSKETIEKFEQGLRFFGASETYSYTKFTSDRG